jgi:hypothetical protein
MLRFSMQVGHGHNNHLVLADLVNEAVREAVGHAPPGIRTERVPGVREALDPLDGVQDLGPEDLPQSLTLAVVIVDRLPELRKGRVEED